MLKRKCHKYGEALRVCGGLIVLCKCISSKEIEELLSELRFRQAMPKPRLPKGHQTVRYVQNADV